MIQHSTLPNVLRQIDDLMKTRQVGIRSIDCKIKILNILITVTAVSTCFLAKSRSSHLISYIYLSSCAILAIKSAILIWAIIKFKRFIDTIELFVNPNKGLMLIHCINTVLYMMIQLVAAFLYHRKLVLEETGDEEQAAKVWTFFAFFLIL